MSSKLEGDGVGSVKEEVFTLFINGLPWEIPWERLSHLFREQGEVSDVYVSKKRRQFNGSRFGFVRYKHLEEVVKAARNLNGARLEGRRMEVSFAKYANKGLCHRGLAQVVSGREAKQIEGRSEGKLNDKDGRSFKEVVEGAH